MRYLILLPLLAAVLGGCARQRQEPTLMTLPPPESTTVGTTVPETHPDTAEYYIKYVYPHQLQEYYTALIGRWEGERYLDRGRSPLAAALSEGDPLENVGFLLEDLDGDGWRELVIGAIRDAEEEPLIFELWTAAGEEPELVLCAGEEDRYFMLEGDPALIARETEDALERQVFLRGTLTGRDVEAGPGRYRVPRYFPFFLYAP